MPLANKSSRSEALKKAHLVKMTTTTLNAASVMVRIMTSLSCCNVEVARFMCF